MNLRERRIMFMNFGLNVKKDRYCFEWYVEKDFNFL